jgi:hypothetical protein
MRRQRFRADRGVHRRHQRRRDDHGSRHQQVGHRLRRHQRRRRGSYRRRHHRGVHHRPGRPGDRPVHRDADHRDAADDQLRPDAAAYCLVRRRRDGEHRDGEHRVGALEVEGSRAARRAEPRRTGCFRPAACGPPASGLPGVDRASGRAESGSGPVAPRRPAAVRQPVPAARAPAVQRVWGRRAWPPGLRLSRRAWQPPRRCRTLAAGRACRRRRTHAVDAPRALLPSTTRI